MRISLPAHRRMRGLISGAVWLACVAAALWLYYGLGGPAAAVAITETESYKVSPSQLGRLTSVEVTEGQVVTAGQVIARLDTDMLEKQVSVAQAEIRHAASEVKATEVSLETMHLQMERNFEGELEAVQVELEAAQAAQARDAAALKTILEELRRAQDLLQRGLDRADRVTSLEFSRAGFGETVRSWPARLAAIEARRRAAAARLTEWQGKRARVPAARAARSFSREKTKWSSGSSRSNSCAHACGKPCCARRPRHTSRPSTRVPAMCSSRATRLRRWWKRTRGKWWPMWRNAAGPCSAGVPGAGAPQDGRPRNRAGNGDCSERGCGGAAAAGVD